MALPLSEVTVSTFSRINLLKVATCQELGVRGYKKIILNYHGIWWRREDKCGRQLYKSCLRDCVGVHVGEVNNG